ncbi:flagellar filament capping protein FliD [Alteribacillus sp. YIM 98480]|uniref:flagellar filament capping protein FliD n=1 Tax=Alteribacillus sp. YIM 98480 TaxID=2606599 RepID=UPI00131BCF9C|nr:flagellar filament capping protein FliD [Alteribacillus sp. YIM 98480]
MASGMDIDQMVKDLMRAERVPVDKMVQKRQTIEWQMEEYRSINRLFDEFRNNIFDTVMRRANMGARSASSTDDSRITATASSTAGNASYQISEVKQLAQAASQTSSSRIGSSAFDSSKSLASQEWEGSDNWKAGMVEKETITLDDRQQTFSIEKENLLDTAAEDMVVTVNGKLYDVVTDDTPLEDNQVRVSFSAENDKIDFAFSEALAADSDISVQYFTKDASETFTPSEAKDSFQLKKGAIAADSMTVTIDGGSPLEIITDSDVELTADQAYVDTETGKIRLGAKTEGPVDVTYTQQYMSGGLTTFNEQGEAVKDRFIVQSSQSMDKLMQDINRSSLGVSAFYDDFSGKLAFNRTEAGNFNTDGEEMIFEGTLFTEALGMTNSNVGTNADGNLVITDPNGDKTEFNDWTLEEGVLKDSTGAIVANETITVDGEEVGETDKNGNFTYLGFQGGQNAKFTLNGLETERTSNTFTVNSMTMTLKDTFTASEETVSIRSSVDTDSIFDTITGFVDEYNDMLDTINEKLGEDRYRDYPPLTDEQKQAMTDREIELWEEKAKSGLIKNDRTISSFTDTFRLDLYGRVDTEYDTAYNQLTTIGISTTSNYMDRGKLEVDETKLREAIENDAESVFELFAADGDTRREQGIARRLRGTLDSAIESLAERAGGFKGKIQNHQFTLGRNINNIDDQISHFERRLSETEDRYWRQFTAMEQAIARANEQANYFYTQMFGGAGGF